MMLRYELKTYFRNTKNSFRIKISDVVGKPAILGPEILRKELN